MVNAPSTCSKLSSNGLHSLVKVSVLVSKVLCGKKTATLAPFIAHPGPVSLMFKHRGESISPINLWWRLKSSLWILSGETI